MSSAIAPDLCAALVAALTDGVVIASRDLTITHVTRAVRTLLGWDPAALVGRSVGELYWDAEDGARLALADRANPTTTTASAIPRALRTAEGTRRICLVHTFELDDCIAFVLRDAGDFHDALDRVVRSEASLRAVIESAPDAIIVHQQGRIVYANRAMVRLWGGSIERLLGMHANDLVHPDDRAFVLARQRQLAQGAQLAPYVDERLLRADGTPWIAQVGAVNVVYEGKPAVLVVARDVTEQRALEVRLGQADRMVALGTLAAGVAHEIGNPLTYMLLRLDAAGMRTGELRRACAAVEPSMLPTVDELGADVAAVVDGARRVRNIVAELKVFARGDDAPERLDVTVPLDRAIAIATHELKHVQLVRDVAPAPPVMASDGKLTQVFLNLLLNAVHAVRAAGTDLGSHRIDVRVWAEAGETRVAVADTGVGIPAEELSRIFDPFFSTKPPGEGAGLGLAITQSIVASLGGEIRVVSRPGQGSTFTVALPSLRL